jgi:aquaporin Z
MTATRAESAPQAASPAAANSHWQEYAIEAALLGVFMLSACLFTVLLFHPASPVPGLVPDRFLRRVLMGLAMGGTAVGLIYSAWGKQSGAHFNPAVTLTFARLGRIAPRDAAAYVVAQFAGAVLGVLGAMLLAGRLVADASVRYAVTVPGPDGPGVALEAPLSGMSMNPARTAGSAVWAHDGTALWIYFTAPLLGMLSAAQLHLRRRGRQPDACAKLHHQNEKRCIFCEHRMAQGTSRRPAAL